MEHFVYHGSAQPRLSVAAVCVSYKMLKQWAQSDTEQDADSFSLLSWHLVSSCWLSAISEPGHNRHEPKPAIQFKGPKSKGCKLTKWLITGEEEKWAVKKGGGVCVTCSSLWLQQKKLWWGLKLHYKSNQCNTHLQWMLSTDMDSLWKYKSAKNFPDWDFFLIRFT